MLGSNGRKAARHGRSHRGSVPQRGRGLIILLGVVIILLAVVAGTAVWMGHSSPPAGSAALTQEGTSGQPVFVLGDSFAQSPYFQDQFPGALADHTVVIDGVGGSSLEEQRQRFNSRIEGWKSLLVILDGGLTDTSAERPLASIIAQLDPGCGRWLYVEPPHSAANGAVGSSEYRRQSELVAAVRARWPEHFVPLIEPLAAGGDGSAQDLSDIKTGWIPSSLRQPDDPIHLNAAGNRILVSTIAQAIARLERETVPECAGPSMEQMQAAVNAP